MKKISMLHTVRGRLLLLAIAVEALMLVVMVGNSVRLLNDFMSDQAMVHVKQVIPVITAAVVAPLAQRDYATVQAVADECRATEGIDYVAITDRDGKRVASSVRQPDSFHLQPAPKPDPGQTMGIEIKEALYDVGSPISLQGQYLGTLHFGFDTSKIKIAQRALLLQGVGIAAIELLLSALILSLTFFWLTRRLSTLTEASMQVAEGNLARQLLPEGGDDLGRLGAAFNTMSRAIADRINELTTSKELAEGNAQALAESEERLKLALEGASLGTWDWNIPAGNISVNERWIEMLGYSRDEIDPRISTWENLMHPDDIPRVHAVLTEHLEGRTPVYETEHRLRHKSGSWIWVLDRGRVISRDYEGNPLRACGTHLDITDRMMKDEAIRRSQANLNAFFDLSADFLFVLDLSGNVLKVNRTVTERLGYTEEHLYGRNVLMAHPPEVRDEAGRIIRDMLAGSVEFCPLPLQAVDGRCIPVETRITQGYWDGSPALFGTCKDISALGFSEEKFAKAFEFSSSLMAISTVKDGCYLDVNQSFLQLLGFSREEVIGKTSTELGFFTDPSLRESITAEVAERGFVTNLEITVPTKSGESRVGLFSSKRIRIQAQEYLLTVMNDITELKQMEKELGRARENAVLASNAKSLFVANVSHEIRTPLNEILGLGYLLSDTDLSEKQHDYQVKIIRAAKSLLQIINDILDFSKIEAGKLDIRTEAFNARETVDAVLDSLRPLATAKSLELSSGIAADLPEQLFGSPHRLTQILGNLVHNAIKFTDRGSISVTVEELGRSTTHVELEFRVNDSGTGIPEAEQGNLFKAFSQVDSSPTRRFGGTGLGLAICKQICEAMGGSIRVESTPGRGSDFIVRLPFLLAVKESPDAQDTPCSGLFPAGALPSFRGARILVVDDNEINRQIAEELLCKTGAQVFLAEDGAHAVERVREETFDVVLMDIQMPVMDGLTATGIIRSLDIPKADSLPILAMTSHAMSGDREKSLIAGMNDHLTKPIEPDTLYGTLARWLPQQSTNAHDAGQGGIQVDAKLSIPGVDVVAGLRRAGGNGDLYRKLLRTCAGKHADGERMVRQHLADGRRDDALRLAHSVKGVAGNLGAVPLHQAAAALEEAIAEHTPDLEHSLGIFGESLASFIEAVAAALPGDDGAAVNCDGELPRGRPEDLKEILLQLEDPIRMHRPRDSRVVMALLCSHSWPANQANELAQLTELLDRYQFEAADEVRQRLLGMITT